MPNKRPYTVRILYKSGNSISFDCEEFSFKGRPGSGDCHVTWKNASPNPLFLGVENIEAIYEVL